jgi:light-regulated signal transduction histidine kinase (bacteriophytochrome)
LEGINSELSRSNSDLEHFAYVASHDLHEPLRSMSSCLQLLKKRYESQLDALANELIARAVAGSQRMRALIDDLLALSKVNASAVNLVETDSAAIFEQVCANLAHAIEESGASVSQEGLPMVISTPQMLSQLLQNLISNAIKFRDQRPPVVQVRARRDGNQWVFSVADQGIGIDPEHFDRIFQFFQRLHTTEAYPGTGLGLAICKKIVDQHGGKIWVESTPGIGTTFYFTQPAVSPA